MKRTRQTLIIILMLLTTVAGAAEIQLIRLKYADPHSVAHTIGALFGGRVNAIPVPSVNGVAINASDKYEMEEIAKLAAVLDRRPATLRFSIQSASNVHEKSQTIGYRQRGRAETAGSTTTTTGMRTVVAMEFAKASLTDELVQIYSLPGWYGPETVAITTSHGLKVSGHLIDEERVMVQVWYAQNNGGISEVLLSEVETRAGEWFSLGGLEQSSNHAGHSIEIGSQKGVAYKKTGGQIDRRFMLRVDVIR
ncbi:MAG: hypothetical protein CVV42_15425 [Candidatus Riflebacteria bacterium HGW-Riflebacteria-2]|nr:MAG: hypothetical protein CVV42_15425 [Candidatus Riflebacteria bacterium HGW-Riflebacteria-2]